jgi:hypothetical protein
MVDNSIFKYWDDLLRQQDNLCVETNFGTKVFIVDIHRGHCSMITLDKKFIRKFPIKYLETSENILRSKHYGVGNIIQNLQRRLFYQEGRGT